VERGIRLGPAQLSVRGQLHPSSTVGHNSSRRRFRLFAGFHRRITPIRYPHARFARQRPRLLAIVTKKASLGLTSPISYHPVIQHAVAQATLALDWVGPRLDRVAEEWSTNVEHGASWPAKIVSGKFYAVEVCWRIVGLAGVRPCSRPMSSNVCSSTPAAAVFTRPTPRRYRRSSTTRRLGSTSASSRAGPKQCKCGAQMGAGARRSSLVEVISIRLSHAIRQREITYLQIACFTYRRKWRSSMSHNGSRDSNAPCLSRRVPGSASIAGPGAGDGPQLGEPFVPKFRAFCLTPDDRIEWGLTIDAPNLQAAIAAAHRACQEHFRTSKSRVEIWRRADKLYTSPPEQDYR
jgi:hypothetical protein